MRFRRSHRDYDSGRPQWRPIPAWSWMLTAAAAVGLTALAITSWLLSIASHAKLGTDLVNARLDAVRTGLAAGAGAGAAVGLMLAFRRQHHQEVSTALTDHDATQRRITELYTKAVEQLGSDKAPVRLGGLYALERLAQDNQQQRQTIVNVICAYLRMPFLPQAPDDNTAPPDSENSTGQSTETSAAHSGIGDSAWLQEKQVRLTAQRILSVHLCRPDTDQLGNSTSHIRFWSAMRLDLTGATLFDFDLSNGMITDALFNSAIFSGEARFGGATFSSPARFGSATFSGDATFIGAAFSRTAWFGGAAFSGAAWFVEATFSSPAYFDGTTFGSDAWFDVASFGGDASFTGTTFGDAAGFDGATFSLHASFDQATFSSTAEFDGATFSLHALFDQATFNNTATFNGTTFGGDVGFHGATFVKPDGIDFTRARFRSSVGNRWPPGWQISGDHQNGFTVVYSTNSTDP